MSKVTRAWRKQKSHWSRGVHRGQGAVARGASMKQESSALQMLRGMSSKWGSEVMGSNNQLRPPTGSGEAKIRWPALTSTENTERETRSQEWGQQERGEEKRAESARELHPLQTWQAGAWAEEMKTPTRGLWKWPLSQPEALSQQCFLIISGRMHRKHMDLIGSIFSCSHWRLSPSAFNGAVWLWVTSSLSRPVV